MQALTSKQRAFCGEYVKDGNRRQAAIRAGYSPQAASQQAGKLEQDPRIQAMISKLRETQAEPGDKSLGGHVMALAAIRDKALADGKYQAAATAEKARGIALGYQSGKTRDPLPPPRPKDDRTMAEVMRGKPAGWERERALSSSIPYEDTDDGLPDWL
ncbi:MAG: terminase small subunit [Lysobacterales bacterium]